MEADLIKTMANLFKTADLIKTMADIKTMANLIKTTVVKTMVIKTRADLIVIVVRMADHVKTAIKMAIFHFKIKRS